MTAIRLTRRAFGGLAAGALAAPYVARAADGKIVATTWGGGVGDMWKAAFGEPFAKRTGIAVDFVESANPATAVQTQAADPQFNVVTSTYVDAVNLDRAGLLEGFDPATLPLDGVADSYVLKSAEGKLLGAPSYRTIYGIAYNTDLVKPGEITSWKDLADPKWKGKIATARPFYGSIYDLTAFAYATGGDSDNVDEGLNLYKQIADNALTAFTSLAQANQLLSRGEIYAAPYYAARVWAMKSEGLPVELAIPEEGALALPYLTYVPKNTFAVPEALKMLNYIMEPEPQAIAAEMAGYLPLAPGAKVSPRMEQVMGMPYADLTTKLIEPNWTTLAVNQDARVQMIEKMLG